MCCFCVRGDRVEPRMDTDGHELFDVEGYAIAWSILLR